MLKGIVLLFTILLSVSVLAGDWQNSELFREKDKTNYDKPFVIIGFNGYFQKYKLEWYDDKKLEDQTFRFWPYVSLLYPISEKKSLILNLQIIDAPMKMDLAEQYNFTVTFSCGLKIYLDKED